MSIVRQLLEDAHRVENEAGRYLTAAVVQRRATRPTLSHVAREFRRAADLIDEALAQMTTPQSTAIYPRRNPDSE